MNDIPRTVKINEIKKESSEVKTFYLNNKLEAKPGQFVMIWIPGLDEKPFALSHLENRIGITVKKRGKFTKQLFKKKEGELLGIRGPYGNGFEYNDNACVVAGGIGIAPLAPLIEKLNNSKVVLGAESESELAFRERFDDPIICTDDGSVGFEGMATDFLIDYLDEEDFDVIYVSGPEIMIKLVFEMCEEHDIYCYASLERYMKCGFGVCGQCDINGYMVCKDGPVFGSKDLRKMNELGKYARTKTGKKLPIKEYFKH